MLSSSDKYFNKLIHDETVQNILHWLRTELSRFIKLPWLFCFKFYSSSRKVCIFFISSCSYTIVHLLVYCVLRIIMIFQRVSISCCLSYSLKFGLILGKFTFNLFLSYFNCSLLLKSILHFIFNSCTLSLYAYTYTWIHTLFFFVVCHFRD